MRSVEDFKIFQIFPYVFRLIAGLPAYRPAVRPTLALGVWLQIFHTAKVITSDYKTVVLVKINPLRNGVSFHPSLFFFSFCIR